MSVKSETSTVSNRSVEDHITLSYKSLDLTLSLKEARELVSLLRSKIKDADRRWLMEIDQMSV